MSDSIALPWLLGLIVGLVGISLLFQIGLHHLYCLEAIRQRNWRLRRRFIAPFVCLLTVVAIIAFFWHRPVSQRVFALLLAMCLVWSLSEIYRKDKQTLKKRCEKSDS